MTFVQSAGVFDSQTISQGKSLGAVATGPDWCRHSQDQKPNWRNTIDARDIFHLFQKHMVTVLEMLSVHVQVCTHAGWAQMHVTLFAVSTVNFVCISSLFALPHIHPHPDLITRNAELWDRA